MTEPRNDKFPDQRSLDHVRDELGRCPSRASVMIGSGFSRNARKNRPDSPDIPLLADLADALSKDLSDSRDKPECEVDTQELAQELAQEYEQVFGRARLHRRLIESVRDGDFGPGEPHLKLLKLPWRDVFTTNWDTLLEQCLRASGRQYAVVTSAEQLPLCAPPRIVKLHGSLPGTFPLIFTKEDYRKYPTDFAPFVNTVQQAMLETVFLLLGFSGKDRNFRRWIEWVGKYLGESAPRIYLAGWLGLSPLERRELIGKNIQPIDLAEHPKAEEWEESGKHVDSLEWLLSSLEQGRPYSEGWPSHLVPNRLSVRADLDPLQSVANAPEEEPWEPAPGEPHEPAYLERVRDVLRVWRSNRESCPSWLVMPFEAAQDVRTYTDHWQPRILAALPNLAGGVERLGALSELVWRGEVILDPLEKDLKVKEAVAGVLQEVDCSSRLVGGEVREDLDWRPLRRQWRTLAGALLTAARFDFDREEFDHWIKQLAPFMMEDEDLVERVEHEKCLWALSQQDYLQLSDLVGQWNPRATDPAWLLRKAAMLAELGRHQEARELAFGVLETVRKWSDGPARLAGGSREAWALRLVHVTDDDREDMISKLRELESRNRELAQLRCDPTDELRAHERAVVGSPPVEKQRPFDLGRTAGEGWSFSNVAHYRALAALRAIRFVEVVGSPSAASGGLLHRAAEALRPYSPQWTAALTLRCAMGNPTQEFSRTLSRWRIASMAPDLALSLAQSQRRTIDLALEQVERSTDAVQTWWLWSQRLEAAMEALSRFVLRLKPEEVVRVLQLARSLYCDPRIHSRIQYSEPLAHLLRRSWEALPGSRQAQHALDLLRLPIVGVDGFTVHMESHFEDPGYLIIDAATSVRDDPVPARSEEKESAWVEVVDLVDKGLRAGGTARERAAVRLAVLSRWQRLTSDERQRLAGALWDFGLDCDGLPRDADLHPWVFLILPEPEVGLAERRLRSAWVRSGTWEDESRESLEKVLAGAGAALSRLPEHGHEIKLSNAEADSLRAAIDLWAGMEPSTILPWDRPHVLREWRSTLRNVAALLLELEMSPGTAQTLLDTVRKLSTEKTPAFELVPGIVKSDQELADSAAALLRIGLGGSMPEQREQAASAWGGLYLWLRASALGDSGLPRPPDHLVFEIGVIISAPRWSVLSQALEIAAWVYEEGMEEHRELLGPPALSGLGFLRRALVFREISPNPVVEQPQVSEDDVDVPLLRWRCVRLSKAMDSAGFGGETAVAGWLEDAETDPLPEVRFAVEEWQDGLASRNAPDAE